MPTTAAAAAASCELWRIKAAIIRKRYYYNINNGVELTNCGRRVLQLLLHFCNAQLIICGGTEGATSEGGGWFRSPSLTYERVWRERRLGAAAVASDAFQSEINEAFCVPLTTLSF